MDTPFLGFLWVFSSAGEAGKTVGKLLAAMLALHMDPGLFVLLDHPDGLLADGAGDHHHLRLGLGGQTAVLVPDASCLVLFLLELLQILLGGRHFHSLVEVNQAILAWSF